MDDQALLSFGLWIKRRRKALDLTQEALAALVGCSKDLIVKIEGDARRPSREIAALLATHLQLAPEEREDFIRCARAEFAPDRLPPPSRSVPRAAFPARPPADHPRSNLPAQLSSFLGRNREIADLQALLGRADVRLVTLTGPGGTGKTRLALAVAAELALTPSPAPVATGAGSKLSSPPLPSQWERGLGGEGHFPDGVFFVDLAPISDPALVATTIAQTLGVTDAGSQPIRERLKRALRTKDLLLLLDNFEQVLDAAPLVAELLAVVPGLKVLVTSRVTLHLSGEHEYAVPPLALPPTDDGRRTTDDQARGSVVDGRSSVVGQYAAVQLFIARAQAAKADFAVTNATAPAVAEICVRLDGLPLAIELAAARIKLFTPEALLNRLSAPLALLTGGPRDRPTRQQTIRNTIDWSYTLLSADEQRLFRRLGVFVGGCTLEAAEFINDERRTMNDETAEALDNLSSFIVHPSSFDRLASLLDQSLLVVLTPVAGEPRYGMLELVRDYALERMRAANEEKVVRRHHAAYFAAWGEQVQPNLYGADMIAWLDRLARELGNFRVALDWSLIAEDSDALYALRLFGSLWELWYLRYPTEGAHIVQRVLVPASARQDLATARIYNAAARLGVHDTILGNDIALLEQSLALARQFDDRLLQAEVLNHMGESLRERNDFDAAERVQAESLAISQECDNAWREGWVRLNLGRISEQRGDLSAADTYSRQGLALFARLKNPLGQGMALHRLSRIAERRGEIAAADHYHKCAREFLNHFGPAFEGTPPVIERGHAAYKRGDYQVALALLRSGYDQAQQGGYNSLAVVALILQAMCHQELGDLSTATRVCRQAQALILANPWPLWMVIYIAIVVANVAVAGAMHSAAARVLGSADAFDASIGYHMEHDEDPDWKRLHDRALAACRAALGEEAFDAAWAAGQALTLEQAVAEALGGSAVDNDDPWV